MHFEFVCFIEFTFLNEDLCFCEHKSPGRIDTTLVMANEGLNIQNYSSLYNSRLQHIKNINARTTDMRSTQTGFQKQQHQLSI